MFLGFVFTAWVEPAGLSSAIAMIASSGSVVGTVPLATGEPVDVPVLRLVLALVIAVGTAWGAAVLIKRGYLPTDWLRRAAKTGHARPNAHEEPSLHVLETRRLSAHGEVSLLAYGDKRYIVAMSQAGAVVLDTHDITPGSDRAGAS